MNLTEKDLKKIKSVHVTTKLPVKIYDENFTLLKSYTSGYKYNALYELPSKNGFHHHLQFHYGIFNEIFMSFQYKDCIITLGPFLTHNIPLSQIQEKYKKYYRSIPRYALGDIRDFLILLGFLFDVDFEKIYSDELHRQVYKNKLEIKKQLKNRPVFEMFEKERYSFYYENQILNLVEKGETDFLKKGITSTGASVSLSSAVNSVRTEKNYNIIILEKLTSLAIHSGKDILRAISLRDFYIKQTEKQEKLIDVLVVRDSAIIHFTAELHELSTKIRSPMIKSVIQYINLKVYDVIKVSELAKTFYISENALRRNFKKETGVNITEYINMRKISEAKLFLKEGVPSCKIAEKLNFYDTSHFYRMFKKYTGISPSHFKENSATDIPAKNTNNK